MQLRKIAGPVLQTAPPLCSSDSPMAREYTSGQLESARTNLEVISKHVRDYMVAQGEWVECVQPTTQSALPQDMTTPASSSKSLGDLKVSSVNHVIKIWPAHYRQFGTFVTKMSDEDRDVLLITDSKIIQARIDANPREKALQAGAEEKVSLGQLGIRQGSPPRPSTWPLSKRRRTSPQPSP